MKLTNIIKESKTIQLENNPCWKNYQQIGTKMKDGKEVPNCVPKNEVKEASSKSMPGQWVGYIETPKGDKLMGMFKSAMGAKQWLSKNSNKLLNTDGVERVGIMGIDEWNKFHAKYAIENVNEGARIILINPNTNKFTKTHLYSGPNRDADKEVEKLNSKLTPAQKDKGLYWKISTYENVNEIKKGSVVIPYAMDRYGEFIVDKVFKNKDGETSYTGKFKKNGERREFILHSKDRIVKESVNKKFGSKYDIGAGSMGSGTTFWNRAQEVDGDYKTIAHVSDNGKVTFHDKKLPNDVKKHIEDYAKTKTESVKENCGCGGVKTSNPYSLSEFVIKENDYKLGNVEYTAKNMGPVDIMKLAFAYHQAPITKLAGKNIDHRIRVARDLGRLIGKNHINPNERGKEPAWLLYPYKGKLVSTEEYKEIYNGLFDKLKRLVKYIKNADPATRRDAAAAKAAARADIKKEF